MGDCLTTTTKSQDLPKKEEYPQPERTKPTFIVSSCPNFQKTHTVITPDPNIKIKAPPIQQRKPSPRDPSIDLRESCSNRSRSRSGSCSRSHSGSPSKSGGSRSRSNSGERKQSGDSFLDSKLGSKSVSRQSGNGNLGIAYTDSYVVKQLEENRRSSNLPVQINPTVSYLVNGGQPNPHNDVNFQLVNGQILISRAEPLSRSPRLLPPIQQSAVVVMSRPENRPSVSPVRPQVQQSTVLVTTKVQIHPQEAVSSHPTIEQSAVMVQTRPNNP